MIAGALLLALAPVQQSDYDLGVAARARGDLASARSAFEALTAREPNNADGWLQLGLTLLQQDALDDAEAAFRRSLAIAPGYADAELGLARVAQRRGDIAGARAQAAPLAARGNPEAAALIAELDAVPAPFSARWRVNLDGAYSDFADDRADWGDFYLSAQKRVSDRVWAGGSIEPSRRFGRTDIYIEARVDADIGERISVYGAIGGTPSADFRPEYQLSLGGRARVSDGGAATVLTLDLRQAQYDVGDVQTVTPGVEQYFAGGRAWVTGQWINLFDENGRHRGGWLARGDLMATDRLRLYAGYADAPDTSEGLTIDVNNVFAGAAYAISERTTVRAGISHEDRSLGANRTILSLGVGLGF